MLFVLIYVIWGYGTIKNNTGTKQLTFKASFTLSYGTIKNNTGTKHYYLSYAYHYGYGTIKNNTGTKLKSWA